jgi:hypothetical protein
MLGVRVARRLRPATRAEVPAFAVPGLADTLASRRIARERNGGEGARRYHGLLPSLVVDDAKWIRSSPTSEEIPISQAVA